jgi:PAS domain S-box-containing protein
MCKESDKRTHTTQLYYNSLEKMIHQQSLYKPLIPDEVAIKWQRIVDLIARVMDVPVSRITRFESPQFEIFVTSATKGNPYHEGKRLKLDAGSFCESVISQDAPLLVPTALNDRQWDNNCDKALGMISYLGFPLRWPGGEIFGTLCVLDNKENYYADDHQDLLAEFKLAIESDLEKLDTPNTVAGDDSKLWHAIQSAARESILVMDTQGTFLSANEIGASRFRFTPTELIGKNLFDIVPPDVAASRKKNISEVIKVKRIMRFEDLREGQYFDFTIYPVLNEQHEVEKLVVFAADITERKLARQALEKSERKYRELVDEAATIILRWDIKGNVTFFNEYAQKFFGFPEDEILGKNVVGTIVPETEFTGRDLALLMEEICKDPAKFEDNENENIKRNGERVWIAWKNRPIYNHTGELFEIHSVGIDITARKQAEEALRQSEAKWRSITENSPDQIMMVDHEGNIISINYTVPGLTKEEVLGTSMTCYLPPAYRQYASDCLEQVWATGKPDQFTIEYQGADGGIQYFESNVGPVKDSGNIVALIVSARNVTERKQIEEALRNAHDELETRVQERTVELKNINQELIRQKALFEAVFRDVPDAMVIASVNRDIIMCNPALTRIYGYEPEEVIGKQTVILYESQEEFERQGRERFNLSTEEKTKPYTIIYKRKNGELFPGETVGTPIKDESGATIGFMGVIRDITDRKQAEQELQRSRQHFQYLDRLSRTISQAPDLNSLLGSVLQEMLEIFSVDRAWLFYPGDPDASSWNVPMEVAREGYPGAFDLNMDIPNNPVIASAIRNALETAGPVIHDFFRWEEVPEVIHRFNIKTHMIIALHPKIDKPWILGLHQCSYNREWLDNDKRLFRDIAERMTSALTNRLLLQQLETDIAQRKRAEEQAKLHQAELAHMARLNIMGEMATGIAHELNQPLAAIANYAAVGSEMVDEGNKHPDKLIKALDSVQVQAKRASEIIRRLRQFVKKQSPQRINIGINILVNDVVSFMEAETRKHNIQTQLDLAGELPLVFADAIQIEQVLLNIIRNSLDAMQNSDRENAKLLIRTFINGDGNVHVEVTDNGPGIDEATLGQIFEPFVTTKGAQGMGMGLSISRSIIEAHGGRLWAESEVDCGTTFYFTLPINGGETL